MPDPSKNFILGVHHTIGGMITVAKESISIVRSGTTGDLNDQQKHFLDMAEKSVNSLAGLIKNFFAMQKITCGSMELELKAEDLTVILEKVRKEAAPSAAKKGLGLDISVEGSEGKAVFDVKFLPHVLSNLLENAVKFTDKGRISVTLKDEGKYVRISVKDTGCGMDDKSLIALNEYLNKGERSFADRNSGKNLGLILCREIISRHGGRIWAESSPGQGSIFHFTLPSA